jgi:hypothetical protein
MPGLSTIGLAFTGVCALVGLASQLRQRGQFWAGSSLDVRFARTTRELAVGFAAGSVYTLALFALELVLGLIQVRGVAVIGGD